MGQGLTVVVAVFECAWIRSRRIKPLIFLDPWEVDFG